MNSGIGDTVMKLNVGGMSFRIRISSIFSRTENERLVVFAQMDQENRVKNADAYLTVSTILIIIVSQSVI